MYHYILRFRLTRHPHCVICATPIGAVAPWIRHGWAICTQPYCVSSPDIDLITQELTRTFGRREVDHSNGVLFWCPRHPDLSPFRTFLANWHHLRGIQDLHPTEKMPPVVRAINANGSIATDNARYYGTNDDPNDSHDTNS